jgi:hypothetical protein
VNPNVEKSIREATELCEQFVISEVLFEKHRMLLQFESLFATFDEDVRIGLISYSIWKSGKYQFITNLELIWRFYTTADLKQFEDAF